MKDMRMEVRLAKEEKDKIREGAKILQISCSRFVVMSALKMAEEVIGNESKNE